jgi:hypothetical protein
MGKITKVFDKIADALVPKEIAGILGPASMMFAPQIGLPLALAMGQLGSAKMHSGKLDPMTALGTVGSYYGGGGQDIRASGKNLTQRLSRGIGAAGKSFTGRGSNPFEAFGMGFRTGQAPVQGVGDIDRLLGTTGRTEAGKAFDDYNEYMKDSKTALDSELANKDITKSEYDKLLKEDIKVAETVFGTDDRSIFTKTGDILKGASETIFPGFYDGDEFNFNKALTTVGAVTTISALMPMAEALKKEKMKDKEEEGKIFREWFNSYKRVSGRDYAQSPFPDPTLMEKYKEFMMAEGGRVGYNMGGGIMDAAPGVPPGMELDYRDSGGFIPMGSQEKKDDVPAVLAKNEFVLTSDAMSGLDKMMGGSGDPRAAAKHMYQMMDQLEAMA